MSRVKKQPGIEVKVGVSLSELVAALRQMSNEDREWFLDNLLAAASPQYLESIREARGDYRQGRTIAAEEVFRD